MTKTGDIFKPNIAFAGLTAAGKTTHAQILAKQLGYEYVSATKIILDILEMNEANPDRIWFNNYAKIEEMREGDKVDIELEDRLTKMANNKGGLLLDTWAMAWIYQGKNPMVRVWIGSDQESRARKCYVSQGQNKKLDLKGCATLVNQKDDDTREKFSRRLGFDLFIDRDRYDIELDNSALIPEPTSACSKKGIARFSPAVLDAVKYWLNKLADPKYDPGDMIAKQIINQSDGMITRIGKVTSEGIADD